MPWRATPIGPGHGIGQAARSASPHELDPGSGPLSFPSPNCRTGVLRKPLELGPGGLVKQ